MIEKELDLLIVYAMAFHAARDSYRTTPASNHLIVKRKELLRDCEDALREQKAKIIAMIEEGGSVEPRR